ncbi:MAG: TIGR04076 family protein [Candidatus Omnitrophota bacterium]
MKFPKLKLTVNKKNEYCYHNYEVGDEFILEDFTHAPKHFCLGAMHSIFPCAYALTFGAKFPFRDNQRSILTTCPDGGKLEFKIEVLDDNGNVEIIPKDSEYHAPNPKDMIIEVVKEGKCVFGYKMGDKWETKGLKCIPGFCGAAFHTAFPAMFALNFGAEFHFMSSPNSVDTVTCPDGGNIVFRVKRKE